MPRGKIEITAHAKQRLSERMPTLHPSNYYSMACAARYNGDNEQALWDKNPQLAKYIRQRYRRNNSTEIRYHKGYIWVFCGNHGHSRSLVTVVTIPTHLLNISLEKQFAKNC